MNRRTLSTFTILNTFMLLAPSIAGAAYNANHTATVAWYRTYQGGNVCAAPSTRPPGCPAGDLYFCFNTSQGNSESAVSRMLSAIMLAKANGSPLTWGYDSAACTFGSRLEAAGS